MRAIVDMISKIDLDLRIRSHQMFSNNLFPDMPYCVVKKVISALNLKKAHLTRQEVCRYTSFIVRGYYHPVLQEHCR